MENQFSRLELLFDKSSLDKLKNAHIAIFGIGGVGSSCVEALARGGIGKLDIFDNDTVSITNINRQLIATHSSIGKHKVDVAEERLKDINPEIIINKYTCFYNSENSKEYDFSKYTYIIDAIDSVASKIELIKQAKATNTPIISCMGTGNKLDPIKFEITDISKTSVCPLAKVIRKELKHIGVNSLKVLYSKEEPIKPHYKEGQEKVPGSTSFMPPIAGFMIAGEVIQDIIKE